MIAQYPWVSVKNQERKHIEIGFILTLTLAILSFYSIPDLGGTVTTEKLYEPPPVEVLSIPATLQPPEMAAPQRPTLPVESETDDFADAVEDIMIGEKIIWDDLAPPPPPEIPSVPFWAVEIKPVPIGGWGVINQNVIYPPIAIEARQEGRVVLEVTIGKDGFIKEAVILSGLPGTGLDEAALAAVLKTRFSPAYQRDKPVEVTMSIPVYFRLR